MHCQHYVMNEPKSIKIEQWQERDYCFQEDEGPFNIESITILSCTIKSSIWVRVHLDDTLSLKDHIVHQLPSKKHSQYQSLS